MESCLVMRVWKTGFETKLHKRLGLPLIDIDERILTSILKMLYQDSYNAFKLSENIYFEMSVTTRWLSVL